MKENYSLVSESNLMKKIKQRLYGIDIARLAAMFMVVTLHNLDQGCVLDWTIDSIRDCAYLTLENCAIESLTASQLGIRSATLLVASTLFQ